MGTNKKHIHIEKRIAPRFNPEPEDAEKALFFKNDALIRFPCDDFDREVMDLSTTGLKVFLENENDSLTKLKDNLTKAVLTLNQTPIPIKLKLVHMTEDEYGLQYAGFKYDNLTNKAMELIRNYLQIKQAL
jgi:hypothetical protein